MRSLLDRPELVEGVSNETMIAMRELESRGLSFCSHFGRDNAVDILDGMNRAMELGVLYEWMAGRLGVCTS